MNIFQNKKYANEHYQLSAIGYQLQRGYGYVLVEAMVAISLILVGSLGMFTTLSQSLGLNRIVSERYIASYLAAEGVEVIKNIIDNNLVNGRAWNAGFSDGEFEIDYNSSSLSAFKDRPLKFDGAHQRYNYIEGTPTPFFRKIDIQLLGEGEEIKIISSVHWISRGESKFKVSIEDRFFNWR